MIRIIFFLITFIGSVALLITSHLAGVSFITSTILADQTWPAILFTYGALSTIISLFFVGYEIAATIHRKAPVVVNKTNPAPVLGNNSYPPFTGVPVTDLNSSAAYSPPSSITTSSS